MSGINNDVVVNVVDIVNGDDGGIHTDDHINIYHYEYGFDDGDTDEKDDSPPPPPTQCYFGYAYACSLLLKAPLISGLPTSDPTFAGFSWAFPSVETPLNPEHCSMLPLSMIFMIFYKPRF